MKSTLILYIVCVTLLFCIIGCGGGGSSQTTNSPSATPPSTSQPSPVRPPSPGNFNSLTINPLNDLGLVQGETVCFSVKSFNNYSESDFSKAICGKINNTSSLTLSWNKIGGDVSGYYIYFGTNKNNATAYLANVLES